ncbi:MAG: DNA polymerase IV [Coxiellaceae bacterium]|nr:DNA polymerase IV [Coxiellaceae bacterium]
MGTWQRAIILIDMDAFFASIEQLDNPKLRGCPLAITNGLQGSCVITCSYEARAYGVHTGMSIYEAKKLCPSIIQASTRPQRYAELSTRIMQSLNDITPDIEIYSVDEAFLDITHCQKLYGDPEYIARRAQQAVWQASHLPCSVGLSSNKTCAKYAAKVNKPKGFTVIRPEETRSRLRDVPVTDLCGINKGIAGFLAQYNVHFCGDMQTLPISVLAKRFGNLGRRIWFMCQGEDPEPLQLTVAAPKSMGHGKVLPPHTNDKTVILTYLQHMSEKLAARLRRHQFSAQHFTISLRSLSCGWVGDHYATRYPTDDGALIYQLAKLAVQQHWLPHDTIRQVQITASDPQPALQQSDLFDHASPQRQQVNQAIDQINQRYGELKCMPATLLNRSKTPNVIAPAWKPSGHRKTV